MLALGAALVLRAPFGGCVGSCRWSCASVLFDTGANVLIALASTRGLIGVIATLSALYPLVTVMLAVLIAGERPSSVRIAGGGLALAGAALIAAG